MYRSLTKLVVLRAMSSTLKFHFAVNYESYRFDYLVRQKDGDPGAHKVAHQFSAHFCLVKTPSIAICGKQIKLFLKT